MAVASGALVPDEGAVEIDGQPVNGDPMRARELGLTIVRQEPSLMPDLTVAENLYLGLPPARRPALSNLHGWANGLLKHWSEDSTISPGERVNTLNPEQRFIVDIVKSLAFEQKVLVLYEPTEHLQKDDVARLFERIRSLTRKGVAVVYISHRIREVQAIANRITVLRDGKGQGTYDASELTEDDIVSLIVGTALDRGFPRKADAM